ncbi:hypothetical protein QFZ65_002465 [Arthrobacter sp. B3I9]|nr:AmiS/UreI family transporter [Arthrobacter sp. B3I9]MDQ0850527.1 hypothetical protein [Arthrobacter sp. B3I9]
MSYICLILSGAALLINALGLLGRIPARDSGVFNIVIGTLQLVLAVLLAAAAGVTVNCCWELPASSFSASRTSTSGSTPCLTSSRPGSAGSAPW